MADTPAILTVTLNTALDRVLEVPGFAVGGHLKAREISQSPAGKGVNVARALARLGRSVTATGFVGQADADLFRGSLASTQGPGRAECELIPVPGKTRENLTLIDPEAHTDTHLRTQGFTPTPDDLAKLADTLRALSRPDSVVVFAGSMPSGIDAASLSGLIDTVRQHGAEVVLDLNGKTLGAVLGASDQPVSMISPNLNELSEAVGHHGDLNDQALRAAVRQACPHVDWTLVSMGSGGACLLTEDGEYRGLCRIDARRVVNTVSAGDCLLAGVIDAKLRGLPADQALHQGLTIATASTFHHSPAKFEASDVDALLDKVAVTTM